MRLSPLFSTVGHGLTWRLTWLVGLFIMTASPGLATPTQDADWDICQHTTAMLSAQTDQAGDVRPPRRDRRRMVEPSLVTGEF